MRLFITGATGFIGSHVAAAALAAGHEVIALRHSGAMPRIMLPGRPTWIDGSLADLPPGALAGCDVVIHLAAHGVTATRPASWTECARINAEGTLHLLEHARRAAVPRAIVAGSCFEYGRSAEAFDTVPVDAPLAPVGAYAASKAAASVLALAWARTHGGQLALLRPFMTYGEGEPAARLWPALCTAAMRGEDFPCTNGGQVRDFIRVEAVARTFLDAATAWTIGEGEPVIRNVGTGHARSVREFCTDAWTRLGARGQLRFGALPYRPDEVMRYVARLEPPVPMAHDIST